MPLAILDTETEGVGVFVGSMEKKVEVGDEEAPEPGEVEASNDTVGVSLIVALVEGVGVKKADKTLVEGEGEEEGFKPLEVVEALNFDDCEESETSEELGGGAVMVGEGVTKKFNQSSGVLEALAEGETEEIGGPADDSGVVDALGVGDPPEARGVDEVLTEGVVVFVDDAVTEVDGDPLISTEKEAELDIIGVTLENDELVVLGVMKDVIEGKAVAVIVDDIDGSEVTVMLAEIVGDKDGVVSNETDGLEPALMLVEIDGAVDTVIIVEIEGVALAVEVIGLEGAVLGSAEIEVDGVELGEILIENDEDGLTEVLSEVEGVVDIVVVGLDDILDEIEGVKLGVVLIDMDGLEDGVLLTEVDGTVDVDGDTEVDEVVDGDCDADSVVNAIAEADTDTDAETDTETEEKETLGVMVPAAPFDGLTEGGNDMLDSIGSGESKRKLLIEADGVVEGTKEVSGETLGSAMKA